jgi:5-methylcytosine-specific restriction endonuclease McrA
MGTKTPPFEPYPSWTQAKFFGFLRSGMREKFNRWPPKYEVIKSAAQTMLAKDEHGNRVVFKTGKKAGEFKTIKMYACSECKQLFRQKEVQVDHIVPAGTLKSFDDLGLFAEKLFIGEHGLQVMCKACHEVKTRKEKG